MTATAQFRDSVPRRQLPVVRRLNFRFGEPVTRNRHFVEDDIVLTHFVALLSGAFPPGEESFIRSVRRYSDKITDPVLKKRVAGFIGQEAMHGREHRHLNEQIVALGFPLVQLTNFLPGSRREKAFMAVEGLLPGIVHLAATAAAEHLTAVLGERVLSSEELQAIPAPPETKHLLNWHAMEEMEHKSVAFDVYRAVGGPESVRIGVMVALAAFIYPFMSAALAVSILADPSGWRPLELARGTWHLLRGPLLRGLPKDIALYLRPGFHPDDIDTQALLEHWQAVLFGAQGELVDRLPGAGR